MSAESDPKVPEDEMPEKEMTVTDNVDAGRYELHVGRDLAAFLQYHLTRNRLVLIHTETLEAFAGHGVGAHLVKTVLDEARDRDLRVVPRCPFVASYIKEHPEYQDLVA
ncbi:MAG TPA: GNAT family N-acetyltransferase [Acidimicrobiia bacterium]|jgi:predicted GNAT family acetyltransferase|nr:GNAT family N-acetyltransferase [Acidimicrobiia bacterium]